MMRFRETLRRRLCSWSGDVERGRLSTLYGVYLMTFVCGAVAVLIAGCILRAASCFPPASTASVLAGAGTAVALFVVLEAIMLRMGWDRLIIVEWDASGMRTGHALVGEWVNHSWDQVHAISCCCTSSWEAYRDQSFTVVPFVVVVRVGETALFIDHSQFGPVAADLFLKAVHRHTGKPIAEVDLKHLPGSADRPARQVVKEWLKSRVAEMSELDDGKG